jgi:hypothetical protein
MSNGIKPVAQTYYEISHIKHKPIKKPLNQTEKVFTLLKNSMTYKGMRGIAFKELEQRINGYKDKKGEKNNNNGLLKGLYKGGFSGVHNVKAAPYLFYDVDVKNTAKKKENTHLMDVKANNTIFNELEKISVLCWRSNSGKGMAGVLYVPQIGQYNHSNKDLHLKAGEAITGYVSQYLQGVTDVDKVAFDNAQSKFRQVRLLAYQHNYKRKLNPEPFEFTYKVTKKEKTSKAGVPVYRATNHKPAYGTITAQFDSDNDILALMQNNGFSIVSDTGNKARVKHITSESSTTGEVDKSQNVYFNYSESLGGNTSFTPSNIVCEFEYLGDYSTFYKDLRAKGYKDKQAPQSKVKTNAKSLKHELRNVTDTQQASGIIFKYCYDLQTSTDEVKKRFIKENCIRPQFEKYFFEYLKLTDYKIRYDKHFTINKYVTEALKDVLNFADKNHKVILKAETGKGKTTAFIRDLHKHRPDARILILEPLTIIVNQAEQEYTSKAIFLTGNSPMDAHKEAVNKNMVIATYEQGIKQLNASKFDYVIIDEVHQLLTANSFKRDVIAELTPHLIENKIIGLTGTPQQIFASLGYKLINVESKQQEKTKIEVRYSNLKPFDIGLNHLKTATGKIMIRLNEITTIKSLIRQVVKNKLYKESEILFLHSTKEVKQSKDFKRLAHRRRFADNIKLVFTTSLIDEGLSIDQAGFTDVVFLETSYIPRPEPAKQFFARFRNKDTNRENFLYLRKKKNQNKTRFKPSQEYHYNFKLLSDEVATLDKNDVLSTYKDLFNSDAYLYKDSTVNPYYLAYSVTSVLFMYFNAGQFLQFLETNYNLSFAVNSDFDLPNAYHIEDTEFKKQLKKNIAGVWLNENEDVLNILAFHTQDKKIRADLTIQQKRCDPRLLQLVISNIKRFEKLYKCSLTLLSFDIDDPNTILINDDTLASDDHYKKELLMLKMEAVVFSPKNATDKKNKEKLTTFAGQCRVKETFTSPQMFRMLKSLRVINQKAYNEKMLFQVLEWFNLRVTKDKITRLIKVV